MIPLVVQGKVMDIKPWLTTEESVDALARGNALSGPIAVKMSAYVGYKLAGLPGAFIGLLAMIAPSAVLMLILAALFLHYEDILKCRPPSRRCIRQ